MRAVVQRVSAAQVTVGGSVQAEIGAGLCVLVGVARGDTSADAVHGISSSGCFGPSV